MRTVQSTCEQSGAMLECPCNECCPNMKRFFSFLMAFLAVTFVSNVAADEKQFDLHGASITNAYAIPDGFHPWAAGSAAEKALGKKKKNPKPEDLGWKIVMDDAETAFPAVTPDAKTNSKEPVIAQQGGQEEDEFFPMLVYEDEIFGDFTVTMKIKMVAGKMEQMAGLAFRIQDDKNYYMVRASALGDTFRFYKYVDGIRSPAIGTSDKITSGEWHDLKVECRGNKIICSLDNKIFIPELTDLSYNKGYIGLWTKSDSTSYFRDIKIDFTPRESRAKIGVAAALKRFDKVEDLKLYAPKDGVGDLVVIAAKNKDDIGTAASTAAQNCIRDNAIYSGETRRSWTVTMPLLDENGDPLGAVTVVLKKFIGQSKKNAIVRARAVMDRIQSQITTREDFFQK